MARVTDQNMPVALRAALGDLLIDAEPATGAGQIIRIRSRLTDAEPQSARGALGYFAAKTKRWFKDNWRYQIPERHLAEFAAAREADVLGADFPAAYWSAAGQLEDLTEVGRPAWVLPSRGHLDPAYWDTAHRPGNCPINGIADTYLTPAGDGTAQRPAPGWAGEVEDHVFGDLYQAQRRLLFALPRTHTPNTGVPIALHITAEIDAQASHRGADAWFIVITRPYWYNTAAGAPPAPAEVLTDWTTAQVVPLLLPDSTSTPWTFTYSGSITRNAEVGGELGYHTAYNRLWVRVATAPSRGRYFMRNDWVRVQVRSTVKVYMAKRPRD